jgi:anti-sigma factor RsiW
MAINDMNCNELVELVTDYFEERLPAPERERFEAHLVTCQGCQSYLAQMRRTIHLTGNLSEESIAPDAQHELLRVFRDWKAKE